MRMGNSTTTRANVSSALDAWRERLDQELSEPSFNEDAIESLLITHWDNLSGLLAIVMNEHVRLSKDQICRLLKHNSIIVRSELVRNERVKLDQDHIAVAQYDVYEFTRVYLLKRADIPIELLNVNKLIVDSYGMVRAALMDRRDYLPTPQQVEVYIKLGHGIQNLLERDDVPITMDQLNQISDECELTPKVRKILMQRFATLAAEECREKEIDTTQVRRLKV